MLKRCENNRNKLPPPKFHIDLGLSGTRLNQNNKKENVDNTNYYKIGKF